MKKLLLIAILFFSLSKSSYSQNIVPNPGFEILDSVCPLSYMIAYSYLWESANWGTPDVFDTCLGIPQNNCGYQYAHAGKGMGGIALTGPNVYREYLEIKLDSALKDAHTYCIEYWVSMADYGTVATHPPQIYFSDTLINAPNNTVLNFTPQFEDTTVFITDTANWVLISGQFTSLCNCQYMLIGNFYNDANTDTMQIAYPYNSAYYFIDDVSVTECFPVGITNTVATAKVSVYPNPAQNELKVDADNKLFNAIRITNTLGQQVMKHDIASPSTRIDIHALPSGVYYLQLSGNTGQRTEKFIKE